MKTKRLFCSPRAILGRKCSSEPWADTGKGILRARGLQRGSHGIKKDAWSEARPLEQLK